MKKRRRIIALIFLLLLVAAVVVWWLNRGVRYMKTEVNSTNGSHYALLLPNDMQPAEPRLNENASLEYADSARGIYAMIIDESKAKIISFGLDYDLDTYMKISSRVLDSVGTYVNKSLTVNGSAALQDEIHSTWRGQKVVYRLTCIETQKYFYRLLVWSREGEYDRNKKDLDKIITSFHEVK